MSLGSWKVYPFIQLVFLLKKCPLFYLFIYFWVEKVSHIMPNWQGENEILLLMTNCPSLMPSFFKEFNAATFSKLQNPQEVIW